MKIGDNVILTAQMVRMIKDRWHEQTRLIEAAGHLMLRSVEWGEKQNEPFYVVLNDMETWLKEMKHHVENLGTDLEELG